MYRWKNIFILLIENIMDPIERINVGTRELTLDTELKTDIAI